MIDSIATVWAGTQAAMALTEATAHVELAPRYNVASGSWQWQADWLDDNLNYRTDAVETLYFLGLDTTPANLGVRNTRPSASKWDFLGVASGQPVWIFTDTSNTSVGFASTQLDLQGNISVTLDSVAGPAGGYFSMYNGSTPTIYIQTINGISAADSFPKPSAHTHVNWAFSKKGLWVIKLKAQGTVAGTGASTRVSTPVPLVFAIGGYARWKAARFTIAELSSPAISGDDADPDGDGLNNLMEYALGGDCRVASTLRESDAKPVAPRLLPPATVGAPWRFSFFRRKTSSALDITYAVEASSSLAPQTWSKETGSLQILTSDDNWEQVSVPMDPLQGGVASRFFRLTVNIIP